MEHFARPGAPNHMWVPRHRTLRTFLGETPRCQADFLVNARIGVPATAGIQKDVFGVPTIRREQLWSPEVKPLVQEGQQSCGETFPPFILEEVLPIFHLPFLEDEMIPTPRLCL